MFLAISDALLCKLINARAHVKEGVLAEFEKRKMDLPRLHEQFIFCIHFTPQFDSRRATNWLAEPSERSSNGGLFDAT